MSDGYEPPIGDEPTVVGGPVVPPADAGATGPWSPEGPDAGPVGAGPAPAAPGGGPGGPPDGPPPGGPTDEPSGFDKRWIWAIVLGVILLIGIIAVAFQAGGNKASDSTTTTSSTSTSTSTTSSTTTSTTTSSTTSTAVPTTTTTTTSAPTTTTTAASTTSTTLAISPADQKLVTDCLGGDTYACYQAGQKGLAAGAVSQPGQWTDASDDDVAVACQQGDAKACYVAGVRGVEVTD